MINNARIDFFITRDAVVEHLEDELRHPEPYEKLLCAISALARCENQYSLVIQVKDNGGAMQNPEMQSRPAFNMQLLTRREKEIYLLAMKGLSNKSIAERLFITVETVKSHRKKIVSKAGVKSIQEIKNSILQANNLLDA